jgi:hypothetical protein
MTMKTVLATRPVPALATANTMSKLGYILVNATVTQQIQYTDGLYKWT